MEEREARLAMRDAVALGWAIEVLALGESLREAALRRMLDEETHPFAVASHETMLFTYRQALRARAALAGDPTYAALTATWQAAGNLLDATLRVWICEGVVQLLLVQGRIDEMQAALDSCDAPADLTPERQALTAAVADLARDEPEAWDLLALRDETLEVLGSVLDLPPADGAFAA